MYCSQCGKQISDDSIFCRFCGSKTDAESTNVPHVSIESTPIGQGIFAKDIREGILVYLHDILVMEFSVNKLKRTLRARRDPITIHDYWFFWKCFELTPHIMQEDGRYKYLYLSYSYKLNKFYYCFEDTHPKNIPLYDYNGNPVNHIFGNPCSGPYKELDPKTRSRLCTLPVLKRGFFDVYPTILNQDATYWQSWHLNDNDWCLEPFAQVKQIIEQFEALVKEREQKHQDQLPQIKKEIESIEKELNDAERILSSLYAANLIPAKYRNIGCAYFIYDFFSTSNVPLDNVFLHLDLDKIQSQLNTVIKNQQDSILQQAVIIAQNEEVISQNRLLFEELSHMDKEISNKLSSISENAIDVAQWAQIAASNAEACAWIGLANYLK